MTKTPEQIREDIEETFKETPHEARLYDTIQKLETELTALRSQLSEAQENYEKVWDAAVETWEDCTEYGSFIDEREMNYEKYEADKTTFINKIKKGKE
jgi:peptidoglycan hydrolase CwlO-like protein